MFCDAMCSARERAIAMCEGLFPGEAPQNTQIFVGGGVLVEELVVCARGEDIIGFVDSRREGTGEPDEMGETPPEAIFVLVI